MSNKNYIAALDAGSGSVTLALGIATESENDLNGQKRLSILDLSSRPLQGITRGEITNRQQASETIKELISEVEQRLGMHISDLYTATSGRHVRSATHDQYVLTGEHTDGEIRPSDVETLTRLMAGVQAEEGLRILDRFPVHYLIDGRDTTKDPVGRFGKKLNATFGFVLGSHTLIDRLEKTLLSLGVRSRRTFAGAVVSAEAVTLPEEKELGAAVIDLGAGTTDLCVWHDGVIKYVRSIPFGAGDLNRDIHQQGILEKHVEGLKTTFGRAMAPQVKADKLIAIAGRSPRDKQEISQRNLATIIEHRLREIAEFVIKEIADSGLELDQLRGGIVLTGGGSRLDGIDELFREVTGLEVRLALPDLHVTKECSELAQDPSHSAVIGLLLKALEESSPARVDTAAPHHTQPRAQQPVRPVVEEEESEKLSRPRRSNPLKRLLEGFMSETLDGDEDL